LPVISVNQPANLTPALCFSSVTLSRCYDSTMLKLWFFSCLSPCITKIFTTSAVNKCIIFFNNQYYAEGVWDIIHGICSHEMGTVPNFKHHVTAKVSFFHTQLCTRIDWILAIKWLNFLFKDSEIQRSPTLQARKQSFVIATNNLTVVNHTTR